jgi:hypothetical protein
MGSTGKKKVKTQKKLVKWETCSKDYGNLWYIGMTLVYRPTGFIFSMELQETTWSNMDVPW